MDSFNEFVIPIHYEDVKNQGNKDRFGCKKFVDVNAVNENVVFSSLDTITDRLKKNMFELLDNSAFDPLYSFIFNQKLLTAEQNNQILKIFRSLLSSFIVGYKSEFVNRAQGEDEDEDDGLDSLTRMSNRIDRFKNLIKIVVFLLAQYIIVNEAGGGAGAATAATTPGKKKKPQKEHELLYSVENQKEELIIFINSVLELPNLSNCLWKLDYPEEEFTNLISKMCNHLLENPANQRSKSIKKAVFTIELTLVSRYNYSFYFTLAMINLVKSHEALAAVIAEMYEYIIREQSACSYLVSEIIREISKLPSDARGDSLGYKHLSMFISSLAELVPHLMHPLLSILVLQLTNENYLMRNAIIYSLGSLIQYLTKNVSGKPENRSVRDELYQTLFERVYDVNGYSRAAVLKTLDTLVNLNQLPLDVYCQLTSITIGRVHDKNSYVRKKALQLLRSLISNNPYNSNLRLSFYTEKYTLFLQFINNIKHANKDNIVEEDEVEEDRAEEDKEKLAKPPANLFPGLNIKVISRDDFIHLIKETPFSDMKDIKEYPIKKQLDIIAKYKLWVESTIEFIKLIMESMESICQLLGSVNSSDILGSIEFFIQSIQFEIENSSLGISKMLPLIFSKEQNIKDAMIDAFRSLLLTTRATQNQYKSFYYIAKNLIDLTKTCNLGELTCLEELIIEFQKKDYVSKPLIQALWDIFSSKVVNFSKKDSTGALMILSMCYNYTNKLSDLNDKINLILSIGFGIEEDQQEVSEKKIKIDFKNSKRDEFFLKYIMIILQKLRPVNTIPRFKNNQILFEKIEKEITDDKPEMKLNDWFMFVEQAINTIYKLAEKPDVLAEQLIKSFASQINPTLEKTNVKLLTKFIFIIGHVAIKQLVHIEEIQSEKEKEKEKERKEKEKEKETSTSNKKKKSTSAAANQNVGESIDNELGLNQGQLESEKEIRLLQAEKDITLESNLIGFYSKLIISICSNSNNLFNDETLQISSVLTLCKLMCINHDFCEKNLQLLFTVLEVSDNESIKSNIIICLGDLAFRFPNLIEPWTNKIYNRLSDSNSVTRKNTLLVLTHLILNDMIKVKGQISGMALCLEDPDIRISNLAKVFFTQLSNKGASLYNCLPDIISRLTTSGTSSNAASSSSTNLNSSVSSIPSSTKFHSTIHNFDHETIRNILKYLFAFIQKDKQNESLVAQLCSRFATVKSDLESENIAYCLQLLNYNDKAIKKVIELYKSYQDKLHQPTVFAHMINIVHKTKKSFNFQKPTTELKTLLDELEKKLNDTVNPESNETSTPSIPTPKPPARKAKAKAKSKSMSSDDEDVDDPMDVDSKPPPPKPPTRKAKAKAKPRARSKKIESSEEEESSEQESSSEEEEEESSEDEMDVDSESNEDEPPPPKKPIAKKSSKPPPTPSSAKRKPTPKRKQLSESEEEEESEESSDIQLSDASESSEEEVVKKPIRKGKK